MWVPPIEFAPCAQNASAECGELIVPVDYNNPHEGLFGTAIVRARSHRSEPTHRWTRSLAHALGMDEYVISQSSRADEMSARDDPGQVRC
jgi:hypothetical protein